MLTASYDPQGNVVVGHTSRMFINLLRAFVEDEIDWDDKLPSGLLAHSRTVHAVAKATPSFLWTGREINLPLDVRPVIAQNMRTPCLNRFGS